MKLITTLMSGRRRTTLLAIAVTLLVPALSCFAGNGHGRQLHRTGYSAAGAPSTDWVLDKTVSNVEFYHAITVCNGKNVVLLKFINRNAATVKIGWSEIFVTRNRERKAGFDGRKEMLLPTGITTPASCEDSNNKKTILRGDEVDPLSVIDIQNFYFKDITVALQ